MLYSVCTFILLMTCYAVTCYADEEVVEKIANLSRQVEVLTSTMVTVVEDFKDDIKLLKGHLRQKDGEM